MHKILMSKKHRARKIKWNKEKHDLKVETEARDKRTLEKLVKVKAIYDDWMKVLRHALTHRIKDPKEQHAHALLEIDKFTARLTRICKHDPDVSDWYGATMHMLKDLRSRFVEGKFVVEQPPQEKESPTQVKGRWRKTYR